ncbi:MAG: hypothetical protein ACRDF4_12180 [Rhabdochlamydiaceae bacterium]
MTESELGVEWSCPFCESDDWRSIEGATHHVLVNHRDMLAILATIWTANVRLKQE